jgi:hypothetical protein
MIVDLAAFSKFKKTLGSIVLCDVSMPVSSPLNAKAIFRGWRPVWEGWSSVAERWLPGGNAR